MRPDHVRRKSATSLHRFFWDVSCAVLHVVPIFDSPIWSLWPTEDGFLKRLTQDSSLTGGLFTMALRGFASVHKLRHHSFLQLGAALMAAVAIVAPAAFHGLCQVNQVVRVPSACLSL